MGRGLLAALVATFAALVSHVTGGGQMPGWLGIAVPLVLSAAVCTVLAGRRLALWRLSVGVATSQFLFHALFVLGAFSLSTPAAGHHAHVAPIAAAPALAASGDGAMWVMHAVAALGTIAALYRGERAALRVRALAGEIAQWMRRRLSRALSGRPLAPQRPLPVFPIERMRPARSRLSFTFSRRGPPAIAAF